jgi:hypothetical protein
MGLRAAGAAGRRPPWRRHRLHDPLGRGSREWSEGGARHGSGQACFNPSRRSRAGIVIAVSSASLIRIRRNGIVPLVLATGVLKQTQGIPQFQLSTKLVRGPIDMVSSGDSQDSSRSREQARPSQVAVSSAHGSTYAASTARDITHHGSLPLITLSPVRPACPVQPGEHSCRPSPPCSSSAGSRPLHPGGPPSGSPGPLPLWVPVPSPYYTSTGAACLGRDPPPPPSPLRHPSPHGPSGPLKRTPVSLEALSWVLVTALLGRLVSTRTRALANPDGGAAPMPPLVEASAAVEQCCPRRLRRVGRSVVEHDSIPSA